ncbi:MAG: sulfatase-like hydrolase/transferase [Planctomycetota bacterium]|jgi:arylsulfatase A-like enzyme
MKQTILISLIAVTLWANIALGRGPNIIIFYADDMGIGDLGCYGCRDIKTANIDALAKAGVRFTNYYSAAPVCAPSRAALLTGRYPLRAGVPTNVGSVPGQAGMPPEEITVAELAKKKGYATALIGKWHLGFSHETQPNAQGFDYFFGHHAGCIDYYSHMFYWRTPHHHDLYRNRQEIHEEGQYMTELITREVINFIDKNCKQSFLVYVSYNAPHYPMQSPERFRKMYAHLPRQRADYAALVAGLDESIGKIINRIQHHQLTKDTLVFFMSDNGATVELRANSGGGSNGPFREYKFSLFEGGIRMPAIVSWPGRIPHNGVCNQLTIAMDVFPTIAEAIDAQLPKDRTIDGRSWMPLFKDPDALGHNAVFFDWKKQHAVRHGKWKLVCNGMVNLKNVQWPSPRAKGENAIFLSDIEVDPGETKNLRRQHPQVVDKLLKMHKHWRTELESK